MEGTDICFAPVLSFGEAAGHFHNKARGSFVEVDGIVQPGPAPRFSRTPSSVKFGPPAFGAHTEETLKAWGFSPDEVDTARSRKGHRPPGPHLRLCDIFSRRLALGSFRLLWNEQASGSPSS